MSFRLLGIFAAGMAASVVGFGQTPTTASVSKSVASQSEGKQKTDDSAPHQGVRVFIDPETHQIRQPTQDEMRSLSEQNAARVRAARARSATHMVFRGPGGAVGKELDESSMSYIVAAKDVEGKISVVCLTGEDAAEAKVQGAKEAPASTAKKGSVDDQ